MQPFYLSQILSEGAIGDMRHGEVVPALLAESVASADDIETIGDVDLVLGNGVNGITIMDVYLYPGRTRKGKLYISQEYTIDCEGLSSNPLVGDFVNWLMIRSISFSHSPIGDATKDLQLIMVAKRTLCYFERRKDNFVLQSVVVSYRSPSSD
jgi:hypothetical protein